MPSRPHPLHGFWQGVTLRFRLVALFTTILFLAFLLAGTAMLGIVQAHLVSQIDQELESSAESMAVESVRALLTNRTIDYPSNYFVSVKRSNGTSAVSITDEARDRYGMPLVEELVDEDGASPAVLPHPVNVSSSKSGFYWRAVVVPIALDNQPYATVTIALPLRSVAQTVSNTAKYFILLGLVIIVVGGGGAYYLVDRSLLPLRRIETVAGKIAAGDMSQRVEPGAPTTEVGSLARSLNQMLTQIEQSFAQREESQQRMRRFVSDASHELRTPLAAIRGYGELYRMGAVPEDHVADVMKRIESESTRMGVLVEDLLTLARLDERQTISTEPVNLIALAQNAAFDATALDPARVVQVIGLGSQAAPEELVVQADRDKITQVFTNLIGNVVRYTPAGSPVEIALGARGETGVLVEIRDHGPGIAAAESKKVFTRFYRVDNSRSRASGGSGLGLAIVASIMGLHGGHVELDRTDGGGLTVRLLFPPAPPTVASGGSTTGATTEFGV